LYGRSNVIRGKKLRGGGGGEQYVALGDTEIHTGILCRRLKEDHLEEMCVDGRIVLKSFLKKEDDRVWTGLIWLRIGVIGGLL
jgi:hypothetical protein